jgi:hypothetical protein
MKIHVIELQQLNCLIEYGCGKPKETIENTHNINDFNIKDIFKIGKE